MERWVAVRGVVRANLMKRRRRLVAAYVVMHLGEYALTVLSEEMTVGSGAWLHAAIVGGLAIGLWRGRRLAWHVALVLEVLTFILLVLLLLAPWGLAITMVMVLRGLRIAVLLQRPLQPSRQQRRTRTSGMFVRGVDPRGGRCGRTTPRAGSLTCPRACASLRMRFERTEPAEPISGLVPGREEARF
jgi:hypothetical protein